MAGAVVEGSAANPVPEAGNDTARNITTINENALLLGIVARPIDALRITGDFEFGYNDQSFTRIDPRQVQSYKIQVTYKPRPWANLAGAVEIHKTATTSPTVNNHRARPLLQCRGHGRISACPSISAIATT